MPCNNRQNEFIQIKYSKFVLYTFLDQDLEWHRKVTSTFTRLLFSELNELKTISPVPYLHVFSLEPSYKTLHVTYLPKYDRFLIQLARFAAVDV